MTVINYVNDTCLEAAAREEKWNNVSKPVFRVHKHIKTHPLYFMLTYCRIDLKTKYKSNKSAINKMLMFGLLFVHSLLFGMAAESALCRPILGHVFEVFLASIAKFRKHFKIIGIAKVLMLPEPFLLKTEN